MAPNPFNENKDMQRIEELLYDIDVEIASDISKMRDLQANGKMVLWMYKDFESEEHCNKWLEILSNQIIEIRPTADERLSFYVKIATYIS